MRRIDAGTSGRDVASVDSTWESLQLGKSWEDVLAVLEPGVAPRQVQAAALGQLRILEHRRNLIVSAPTNSGKSLVGLLMLLQAVQGGRRAVLLEPMRAIAREKADELQAVAGRLGKALGRPFSVRISTGDYRIEDEAFAAPPPQQGQIIIATPERLDAILRNPEHDGWLQTIDAVCVDEAHLISSRKRGATLEYLVTALLGLPTPPRIMLLSATLGDATKAQAWLAPCDLLQVTERYPVLRKEVLELGGGEDANSVIRDLAGTILGDPAANVLVFVYQTSATRKLASEISAHLGELAGSAGALAYHSQMSTGQRAEVRRAVVEGRARCLVATTALGLGVNLPATHVILRDTTFFGSGRLELGDILQMIGRAGRGDRPGHASVMVRPADAWSADELARELRAEALPPLRSSWEQVTTGWHGRSEQVDLKDVAKHVAAHLARSPEISGDDLQTFFERSLGGKALASSVPDALRWLSEPLRALAYRDEEGRYQLTTLGLRATRAVLPLELASGFAQLIRDLLSVDEADHLLASWKPLDHLIVLDLLYGEAPALRTFSAALAEQVDAWMERYPTRTAMIYREWIHGRIGASRADQVLGSLGVEVETKQGNKGEAARRIAYRAVFRSIVLLERGQGATIEHLERSWKLEGLDGVEEGWRDNALWLLAGMARLLDMRCFYYHLRERCQADDDRIRRVKETLYQMRRQIFTVQEQLKYSSPLGPLLHSLRRIRRAPGTPGVGVQTIRRLEGAGIRSLADLVPLGVDDLVSLGVRPKAARQIHGYVRQRMQ